MNTRRMIAAGNCDLEKLKPAFSRALGLLGRGASLRILAKPMQLHSSTSSLTMAWMIEITGDRESTEATEAALREIGFFYPEHEPASDGPPFPPSDVEVVLNDRQSLNTVRERLGGSWINVCP